MKKKSLLKDIIKFIIFIAIAALLVWLFCRQLTSEEYRQIFESFGRANYWWLFGALFFGIASHVFRAWRWAMLLEPLGYKPKFWNMIFSVSIAYFANLAFPRLGEVTRCGMLTKYEKIPFVKSFGTVITERTCDLIIFFLLFFINLLVQRELASKCWNDIAAQSSTPTKLFYILAVGAVLLVAIILWMRYVRKHNINNKFVNKIVDMIKGFWDGIKSMIYVKSPLAFIFSSLMIWVCYMYMSKMVFYCLPETASLGYDAAVSALAFCTIGTILIPGGIGIYPILMSAVLSLYGVTNTIGFAMGWMIWTNQTIIIILAGVISLIAFPLYNKHDHDSAIVSSDIVNAK